MNDDQSEKDYWTIEAMEKFGGSFVKALALCARRADPSNLQKIKEAFSLYWSQYIQVGIRMQKENEEEIERQEQKQHD